MKIEITITETINGDVGVGVKTTDNGGNVFGPGALATRGEIAYCFELSNLIKKAIPMIAAKLGASEVPKMHTGPMPNFVRKPEAPEKN